MHTSLVVAAMLAVAATAFSMHQDGAALRHHHSHEHQHHRHEEKDHHHHRHGEKEEGPIRHFHEKRDGRSHHRFHTPGWNQAAFEAGSSGSGATNPPVKNPHKMVVMLSNYCPNTVLNNSAINTWIYPGGGGFAWPPPVSVPQFATMGFLVEADPGSDIINGTALYYAAGWATDMAFAAVRGEWAFSISYPTVAAVVIQPGDIKRTAIYNLVFGHPHNSTTAC